MRRQRRSADPYVVLLLLQLLQKINELPWKPPVTLAGKDSASASTECGQRHARF